MQEINVARGSQDAQHDGFVGAAMPYDCQQCVAAHATRFEFPTLGDENVKAWALFQAMQGQVRVGMDVVGLDFNVLPFVFDVYRVAGDDRRVMFEKIAILDHAQQEHRQIERQRESSRRAEAQTAKVARGA